MRGAQDPPNQSPEISGPRSGNPISDADFDREFAAKYSHADEPSSAPAEVEIRIGSRWDDLWMWLMAPRVTKQFVLWAIPITILLLAAYLRLQDLGNIHSFIFDEVYYIKDAWSLLHLGYTSTWQEGSDEAWYQGDPSQYKTDPNFPIHPPLGKYLIGLGLLVDPANAFWWRAATAIIGTGGVALIMLVAKRLFRSYPLAMIAGFLFAIETSAISLSRVSLLDTQLMFFSLLGVWFILIDRDRLTARIKRGATALRIAGEDPGLGPVPKFRPWLLAAGLAFGAAASVKWSGVWFLAIFGIYIVVADALQRRRLGLTGWGFRKPFQRILLPFVQLVPVALAVYLLSWTSWFMSDKGYLRHWAETAHSEWQGLFAWVPTVFQNFLKYHSDALNFAANLRTKHPYQSNPLEWIFDIRPTAMYFQSVDNGSCGAKTCYTAVMGLPNPLIWWAATAALIFLLVRLFITREWKVSFILVGMLASYVPWYFYFDRTAFQFYSIAFEPYMLLALVFVIGLVLGKRTFERSRRTMGVVTTGIALVLFFALSLYFYPTISGQSMTPEAFNNRIWFPGWR